MSDTKIDITNITENQVRNAGWATERTLLRMAESTEGSTSVLEKIARAQGLDISNGRRNAGLLGDIRDATRESGESIVETTRQASKKTESMLSGLNSVMSKSMRLDDRPGGMFESISEGAKSLSSVLGTANPRLATFASTLSLAATTIGLAIGAMSEMQENVKSLYSATGDTGVGMIEVARYARETGLTMNQLVGIMTKFGSVTSQLGTRRMGDLQRQISTQTNLGADLIMTQEELQEAFGTTLDIMRLGGELEGRTNAQIIERSGDLIKNLNSLSEATGRNRQEILRGTQSLMQQTRIYALQRISGSGAIPELMSSLVAEFGEAGAGPFANMIEGMFMGGPALVDESLRPLLSIVPGLGSELESIAGGIRDGSLRPEAAAARLSNSLRGLSDEQLATLRQSQQYRHLYDFVMSQRLNSENAQIRRTRENTEEGRRQAAEMARSQAAMNASRAAMRGFTTIVYETIAGLEPLLPVLTTFSQALSGLISMFSSLRSGIQGVLQSVGMGEGSSSVVATVVSVLGAGAVFSLIKGLAMRAIGGGAVAAGGSALAGAAAGAGALLRRIPLIGALIGGGLEVGSIVETNRRERTGEISAGEATRERAGSYGALAGGGIGAAIGTMLGGPIGLAIGGALGSYIGRWIGKGIPAISEALGNITGTIAGAFTSIGSTVLGIFRGMGNAVSGAVSGIAGIITGAFTGVTSTISGAIGGIGDIITGAFTGVTSTISGAIGGIGDIITGAFTGVTSTISGIVGGIGGIITGAFTGIPGTITGVFSGMADTVTGVFGGMANTISRALGGIGTFFTGTFSGIRDRLSLAVTDIGNINISDTFTSIRDRITNALPSISNIDVGSTFTSIRDRITNALPSISNIDVGSTFTSIRDRITNALPLIGSVDVASTFTSIRDRITNALPLIGNIDFASAAGSIGESISSVMSTLGVSESSMSAFRDRLSSGFSSALEFVSNNIGSPFSAIESIVTRISSSISGVFESFSRLRADNASQAAGQIERLSSISGEQMLSSAAGIRAMAAALQEFQPGVLAAVGQAFANFMTVDPAVRLQRLAGAGEALGDGARSIESFRVALSGVLVLLEDANMQRINHIGNTFSNISATFSRGGSISRQTTRPLIEGISELIRGLQSSASLINEEGLQRISQIGMSIERITGIFGGSVSINPQSARPIVQGFGELIQGLDSSLSTVNEASMQRIGQVGMSIERIGSVFANAGSVNAQTARSLTEAISVLFRGVEGASPSGPGNPLSITTDQLNQRTIQFYEASLQRQTEMIETLNRANELLESIRSESSSDASRLISAIESNGPRV